MTTGTPAVTNEHLSPPSKLIVIDLFDDAEELDVVGPWEVLSYWCQTFPEDGWRVEIAANTLAPVRCAKGLQIVPTSTLTGPNAADVVIEPGGRGSRVRMRDEVHLAWLGELAAAGGIVMSVCTGALVLAAAGLLRGRPVITHHENLGELVAADGSIDIRRGERWVDDGDVITAAGVSAGIDVALHLVARLISPERATQVRSGIEYFPAPQ